MAKSHQSKFF
jgi:hypothetical protein